MGSTILLAQTPDAETVIADKGYDSEAIREQIVEQGGKSVIPRKKNSRKGNGDLGRSLYKLRHLVESVTLILFSLHLLHFEKLHLLLRGLCIMPSIC